MNDARKLAFISSMTAQALDHVAKVPDAMAPNGEMSHEKKLAFVAKMAKHGLQHFDSGGTVNSGAVQETQLDGPTGTRIPGSTVNNTGLVGSIGDALNLNNNFQAQSAPIQNGTNAAQLNNAYNGAQNGLNQQQNIADTLTPGVGQAAGNQSFLAGQLRSQTTGAGPNPAQEQFKQNANQIAAQTAGAIASTKGISPALQARLIAQQSAGAGQNAAGAEATLQAQQQLAAQNNLQNLSANQVAQGATAVQGVNNAQQNEQNILQNANSAANNANVSMQGNINNVNAGVAARNQQQAGNIVSGIGSAAGALVGLFAHGGMVHKYADGGIATTPTAAPASYVGQWLSSVPGSMSAPSIAGSAQGDLPTIPDMKSSKSKSATPGVENAGQGPTVDNAASLNSDIPYASPDMFSSLMSSGGGGLGAAGASPIEAAALMAKGGLMDSGGKVKAPNSKEKAPIKGNSLKNDKIPALLSEDEIVIPRSITMSDRAPEKAAAFVAHVLAKKGMVKR